jgi:uncharacterized membrane protein
VSDNVTHGTMSKTRLEAFSDGVIAIIITIMVLELKPPHGTDLHALSELAMPFSAYVLSFVVVGIYWNNHHHLVHVAKHVSAGVMWANMHLLFWLSLIPFLTAWEGETGAALPTALLGADFLAAGAAYDILRVQILKQHPADAPVHREFRGNLKGRLSLLFYGSAVPLAFVQRYISIALYVLVAAMWLIPDRRIERAAS